MCERDGFISERVGLISEQALRRDSDNSEEEWSAKEQW
jgi:hypothetical protein